MSKQQNPDIDFGFFASIPRIIRTGYKALSATQKWLYTCLKDLCGDHGTCYRSLRVLADETGISTGMLSESIPALHKAGLIHAEKKRRDKNPTGKEVWHITIIDIWQANGKEHPRKRSAGEQQCSQGEPSPNNVQDVNDNVHHMNDNAQKRSLDEQKRSLCETEGDTVKDTNSEGEAEKESVAVATAAPPLSPIENVKPTPPPKPTRPPKPDKPAAPPRQPKAPTVPADPLADASPEVRAIVAEWCACFKRAMPVTAAMVSQATTLAAYQPEPGEIAECRKWMYQTDDKKWYRTHGLDLGHVARDFVRFRSRDEAPPVESPSAAPPPVPDGPPKETALERRNREMRERYAPKGGSHERALVAASH